MITILGKTEIPSETCWVSSKVIKEVLASLEPGKATLVEAESPKQARRLGQMLYGVAEMTLAMKVHTKRVESFLYVWPDGDAPDQGDEGRNSDE
jgi:hypothetical protein